MRIKPEISGTNIVLVGSFNPPIFNPDWMVRKGIIGEEQAADAKIDVVHREVAAFKTSSFALRVLPNQYVVHTQLEPFISIRDLVLNTFDKLPETPISKLGINYSVHFPIKDIQTRDAMGLRLAPLEPWGEWGKDILGSPKPGDADFKKKHGGLLSLTMIQRDVPGRSTGAIRTRVEPSVKLECGVFVEVNDHYEVENGENSTGCSQALSILDESWEESLRRSQWIIDQVMRLAE